MDILLTHLVMIMQMSHR